MSWYPSYDEEAWGRTEHPDDGPAFRWPRRRCLGAAGKGCGKWYTPSWHGSQRCPGCTDRQYRLVIVPALERFHADPANGFRLEAA